MANLTILRGNLTRDPELRYTKSGTAVCNCGIAVNDRAKVDGEWVDEATFIDLVFWAKTAEVVTEYLTKGSQVYVEGRLKSDEWEDKETKQTRRKLFVEVSKMEMCGSKQQREETPYQEEVSSVPQETAPEEYNF